MGDRTKQISRFGTMATPPGLALPLLHRCRMRILSFVLALAVIPGLAGAPAEARGKKRRPAPPRHVKAVKHSKTLTADDPLLRVGVARPLTVADAHRPGTPIASPQPAGAKAPPRPRK